MNNNQNQFKNPSNKKIMIRDWSSLMERAVELLDFDLSRIALDSLFQDLNMIRGGIEKIDNVLQNDVTADEQKMNRLFEDHDLLKQAEQKLLRHLHQREIERNSHKAALENKAYSFLDKEEWLENEEDSPEKAETPSRKPKNNENVPVKCELRFAKDLGANVAKELTRKKDQYYLKMKDGQEIKLNSEVEIQDEEENGNFVKKKIITLSMPREDQTTHEPLRKSHSEKIPVNIDLHHHVHPRPESQKEEFSDRERPEQSDHFSKKNSQHGHGHDFREVAGRTESQGSARMGQTEEAQDSSRFRKQKTVSGFEEVSGDGRDLNNWERRATDGTGKQNSGNNIHGSNIQYSDFNMDKEIKIPFQDSQPPETIENVDSVVEPEPEPMRPKKENKRSIKEIIMDHNKFDEEQEQFQTDRNGAERFVHSIEDEQMMRKTKEAENSREKDSQNYSKDPNEMIYSREQTEEGGQGGSGMDDTNKKFYPKQRREEKWEEEAQQVDQANATPKQNFYSREQAQNNRNTLNQLIKNPKGQSHRNRMNDLKTHQMSDHLPNNLESLQTVNSNWMTGREDSAHESGNFGQTRGRTKTNEDSQNGVKSFGEIIQDSISGRDQENDYYGQKPGQVERVSHPDEKPPIVPQWKEPVQPICVREVPDKVYRGRENQNDYYEHEPGRVERRSHLEEKPEPVSVVTKPEQIPICIRELPNNYLRGREATYKSIQKENPIRQSIVKEKRLSHKSRMMVLPINKFGSRSNSRGMSVDEYNKRASSLTVNTGRFSRTKMSKTGRKSKLNAVEDDYGLVRVDRRVKVDSGRKINKQNSGGVRYSRPEFSVQNEARGVRIYTGRDAMSRSREFGFERGSRQKGQLHSVSPEKSWRCQTRRSRVDESEGLSQSREIKVRIREGNSKARNSQLSGKAIDSIGHFLNRKVPDSMVHSRIKEPISHRKMDINRLINRESRTMAQSIHKEKSSRINSRSRSSLKHEIKIRSISRSRNLINLEDYCTKIQRESRYLSGSIQNERQSQQHQSKIETLMSNLRKIQKKRVDKPMNNDYYALGRNTETRTRKYLARQPESPGISETRLRKIRQMFPFNQVWFWEMEPREQESKLRKFNRELVDQLRMPVKMLISKVRQSEQVSNEEMYRNEGKWPVERKKGRGRCKVFGRDRKLNVDSGEENVEYNEDPKFSPFWSRPGQSNMREEEKGAPMRNQNANFEEEDFSGVDFGKRRRDQRFNNVSYKDKNYYEREIKKKGKPREREMGSGRPPKFEFGRNRQWKGKAESRGRSGQRSEPRSQVRIRNKRRNYENREFVQVNRKVVDRGNQIRHVPGESGRVVKKVAVKRDNRAQANFGGRSNYYAQGRANFGGERRDSNIKYVDQLVIRNENEEEQFDDDYFEERDPRRYKKQVQVRTSGAQAKAKQGNRVQTRFRKPSVEKVYVEQLEIPKDSQDEDFDDDYFEERERERNRTGGRRKQNRKINRGGQGGAKIKSRFPPREKVYVDQIEIQRDPDESEELDDDYFEEREKLERNKQAGKRGGQPKWNQNLGKKKKGGKAERDSADVVYTDQLIIQRDPDESEELDDDYFEERDSWRNKRSNQREQPRRGGKKNVFLASCETSKVKEKNNPGFSGISQIQPHSSGIRTDSHLSSRFKSFAPLNKAEGGESQRRGWEQETHLVQIESKNEMSPDQKMTSREMKGPVETQFNRSKMNRSEQKTHHTSSTYQNSGRKMGNKGADFSDPYSAQIFTNEETYVENQKKAGNQSKFPGSKRENTFTDYYRTDRQRF